MKLISSRSFFKSCSSWSELSWCFYEHWQEALHLVALMSSSDWVSVKIKRTRIAVRACHWFSVKKVQMSQTQRWVSRSKTLFNFSTDLFFDLLFSLNLSFKMKMYYSLKSVYLVSNNDWLKHSIFHISCVSRGFTLQLFIWKWSMQNCFQYWWTDSVFFIQSYSQIKWRNSIIFLLLHSWSSSFQFSFSVYLQYLITS